MGVPMVAVENAGCSGSTALHLAWQAVAHDDGRVRAESERPLALAAGDLETEDGLTGARRHYQVGVSPSLGPPPLERVQREPLVAAGRPVVGDAGECID